MKHSVTYATQSIHKLLAGISQASHVLVQDSEETKLDRHLFNEAYLMHTSTSPQYSIIASCDVAAAMMEPPGGTALVEESILEALDFRRAMRKVDEEFGENDWWFQVWGPDELEEEGIGRAKSWVLRRTDEDGVHLADGEDSWHGFGDMAPGFNMLDPIKATIITPGLDIDGRFDTHRHPRLDRVEIPDRTWRGGGKDRALQLFHPVHHRHHQGPLEHAVAALQQFKDDYDRNQPLWRVMPEFCAKHPRYERMGLRDLSQHVHSLYAKYDVARLSTDIYLTDHLPAMTPTEAFSHIARRKTERVPIDELEGRITTSLVTPYPPGIPLLIPGETLQPPPSSTTCASTANSPANVRDSRPTSTGWSKRTSGPAGCATTPTA